MNHQSLLNRLKKENTRLRLLVYRDELIGLLNRRGFRELVEKLFDEIRWGMRHRDKRKTVHIDSFSVLFLDVDHFKNLNDRYSHECGDKALVHVGKLVSERVRGIDVVARWGGEEFIVGLLGADKHAAGIVAEDIRQKIATHPLKFRGKSISLSASIGVASLKHERRLSDLIEKADQAMYRAKKKGRNVVVVTP